MQNKWWLFLLGFVLVCLALPMGTLATDTTIPIPELAAPSVPAGGFPVAVNASSETILGTIRVINARMLTEQYGATRFVWGVQCDKSFVMCYTMPTQNGIGDEVEIRAMVEGYNTAPSTASCTLTVRPVINGTAVNAASATFAFKIKSYIDQTALKSFSYKQTSYELDLSKGQDALELPKPEITPSSAVLSGTFGITASQVDQYGLKILGGQSDGALKIQFTKPGVFLLEPEYARTKNCFCGCASTIRVVVRNRLPSLALDHMSLWTLAKEPYFLLGILELNAITEPKSNVEISWSSSNEEIATVTPNGEVSFKSKPGNVAITATAYDRNRTQAKIEFHVIRILERINFSSMFANMFLGRTLQLTPLYHPSNATNRRVDRYESDNPAVATVNASGLVTAHGLGQAIIRAYGPEGVPGLCTITVTQPVEAIVILPEDGSDVLYVNEKVALSAQVQPKSLQQAVHWSVSDGRLAAISNGALMAKRSGKLTLTASARDGSGVRQSMKLTVVEKPRTMKMNRRSIVLYCSTDASVPHAVQLKPIINKGAGYKTLLWSVEGDTAAVDVQGNGLVIARMCGTATIRATTDTGKSCTAIITVKALPPELHFTAFRKGLAYGRKMDMRKLIEDDEGYKPVLKWSSSNPKIAKINAAGIVTAGRKPGIVTITATTLNGVSAKCDVFVNKTGTIPAD